MVQHVQELIDKIKNEGLREAEREAAAITARAREEADRITGEARKEAERITGEAREEAERIQAAVRQALQQAARDTLLTLRDRIVELLSRIVRQEVRKTLTPEVLADLIREAVSRLAASDGTAVVELAPSDLDRLKHGFISRLQEELRRPLTFRSTEALGGGFTISLDEGRTRYDFSDEGLAEFLGGFVNTEVAALLKQAAQEKG